MSDPITEEPEDRTPETVHWSRLREDVGVVVWSSFLVACVATMLFFAFVDPNDLAGMLNDPWWLPNVMTCYALGFFGFWAIAASAASLTAYMLDTSHEHFAEHRPQDRQG
ncbi:MAG: hypothetical protein AB7T07_06760 [Steroidobacteraceae bacterium]